MELKLGNSDWPVHHLPFEIIGDRGELLGKMGDRVAASLPIIISITPPYTPEWKPVVEKTFHLIDDIGLKELDGFVSKAPHRGRERLSPGCMSHDP